jgi:hypothetical protein
MLAFKLRVVTPAHAAEAMKAHATKVKIFFITFLVLLV